MTFEDMDLDSDLEPSEEPPPPEESGNRTFLIAAGILGGITVLALICMVLYALVLLPRQRIAQQGQIATVNAQNTQVAMAITQTSSALRAPTRTPVPPNGGGPAWLGIIGQALDSAIAGLMNLAQDQKGVLIGGLEPGSPAEQSGLKPNDQVASANGQNVPIGGDVVTQVNGKPVSSPQDIENIISQLKPGDTINVTIIRDGKEQTVPIVLGAQSVSGRPAWLGILGQALSSAIANLMGLSPDQKGVLIGGLEPGSPAETAGLFPNDKVTTVDGQDVSLGGDIVISINGKPVAIPQDIQTILNQLKPGDTVSVQILRDGKLQTIPIVLAPRPAGVIPTPTPVVAVALATTVPTIDPRTATVAALLTQAAVNTRTVVPTATALPQTGVADEVGLPALLGLAILLIAVIFIARRLRTAS